MDKKFRLLSLLLSACLITTMFTGFTQVSAVGDPSQPLASDASSVDEFVLPEIIESEEAIEKGYVDRVKSAEHDLNTFVFLNSDGTSTMRIFSHPVKYVAEDGTVQDISLDVEAKSGGGFVTANHEIITTFENKLSDGISLSYNDINITLVPELAIGTNPVGVLANNNKVITYKANDKTSFVYELTYTGFKEDIVVEEYTGQTGYEFTLYTNGLTLLEEHGSYFLADSEGSIKATIGDIIVFTADERNNAMGNMTCRTVRANQEYVLTIHLDADYLADDATAYPIRIDPTIEINYEQDGSGAIEDVTVNELATFGGTLGSLYVGRHPAGSLSRTLMRFPNLSMSGVVADQITAATVEIRDLMCQGNEDITIDCHIYNAGSPAWSESGTTTWSSVGSSYLGTLLDSHLISYGQGNVGSHRYSFNILNAAKAWANGTQSPAKGLVFKANSAFENQTGEAVKTWYKTFAAYNRSDYRPSLSITYNGFVEAETISLNTSKSVNISSAGTKIIYKFVPSSTGFYTFESSNISTGDPKAWLYNSDYIELASNDDYTGGLNFRLTYHLVAGYTYYFAAGCYGTGTGSYSLKLTNATSLPSISYRTVSWGDSPTVSCGVKQKAMFYRFTPSSSGDYVFYSLRASGDPRVWMYNSSLAPIANNDDTAGESNFRMHVTLSAGQTYYIAAGHYGVKTGSYTMRILKKAEISNGVYYLKNIGASLYMDIHGPVAQEFVHQWSFHGDFQSRWYIQKQSDGYYTIRSEYDNKKYVGIESSMVGADNIKLYDSVSGQTKWRIFHDSSGNLIFEPCNGAGRVLYSRHKANGTELRLNYMSQLETNCYWKTYEHLYTYTVSNYYDEGYDVRFANASDNLSEYQRVCSEIFLEIFGIGTNNNVYAYTSCADECTGTPVTLSDTTTNCSGLHSPVNHKSSSKIRSDLISQFGNGSSIHSRVAWTGHVLDSRSSNSSNSSQTVVMSIGMVTDRNNVNLSENVIRYERIYTLLHELSHQLGAPDHYCYDMSSSNCDNPSNDCWRCDLGLATAPYCLMTYRMSDLETRLNNGTLSGIYCSQCMNSSHSRGILAHLNDHHN